MTSSNNLFLLRITRGEIFRNSVEELIERYSKVLKHEFSCRNTLYTTPNKARKLSKKESIRDLIHDIRVLRILKKTQKQNSQGVNQCV